MDNARLFASGAAIGTSGSAVRSVRVCFTAEISVSRRNLMNLPQEPMFRERNAMDANRVLGCDIFEGVVMSRVERDA